MIKIKIKNNKEDQSQSFNISGEYSDEDFSVYEISDKFITKNENRRGNFTRRLKQ